MSNEFRDWYDSVPFFTKWWLTGTVALSIAGSFGLIHPLNLFLLFYPTIGQFQIWRPITALFFYPTSFNFLVWCYFLYNYSKNLEIGHFAGKPADYFYLLLFNWLCCVAIGLLLNLNVLMVAMVMSIVYMWCQLNKDVIVSFWFGTRFKAMYLPWVLAALAMIVGHNCIQELVGIVVGHLGFFLLFKYPQEFGGPSLLIPPEFVKRLFPNTRHVGGFGSAPQTRFEPTAATNRGHNWGRGNRLGD